MDKIIKKENLKHIDDFINKFSNNINELIKLEYNKLTLNSKNHQLLFNNLLYELFKRKKYGLDYECWKELYLRSLCFYKKYDKLGNIPLVLVTKHNEILPFYMKQQIHKTNNTFVHWDTHPDFNEVNNANQLQSLYKQYLKTKNEECIKKAQHIVWDIGAAVTGVFLTTGTKDTIWNMPNWIPDKQTNINYFFKKHPNYISINTNDNIKSIHNLEEFTYDKNPNTNQQNVYAKIQAGKLSKEGLKNMINVISKNGNKYILDVDLDYFVCNGQPLNKSYIHDSFDVSSFYRSAFVDFQAKYPRDEPFENLELIKYENHLKKEIIYIDLRIKHFLRVVRYLKKKQFTPSHISICDSTNVHFNGCETCNSIGNNYVPLNLALYVHTRVMIGLHNIFNL